MEEFKKEIEKVINGEVEFAQSKTLISPDEADKYLQSIGFEQEEFDSNGWDWDFWMGYSKDEKSYVLSGSGWYNDGLSFRENKDN
jgi:hypothetical protein